MDTFKTAPGRQLALAPRAKTLHATVLFALLEPDPNDGDHARATQARRWLRALTVALGHDDNDGLRELLDYGHWRGWETPWSDLAQGAMRAHDLPRLERVVTLANPAAYSRWILLETGMKANAPDALLLLVLDHADDTRLWPWERLCQAAMKRDSSAVFWRLCALGGAKTRRYLRMADRQFGRDDATYRSFRQTGELTVRRLPWWQRLSWWWQSFGLARTLLLG